MKLYTLIFIATFYSISNIDAQDTLKTTLGKDILSIIIEVDTSKVKYKLYKNYNDTIYVISIDNLNSINYKNGIKDDFTKLRSNKIGTFSRMFNIRKKGHFIMIDFNYYYSDVNINFAPPFSINNRNYYELNKPVSFKIIYGYNINHHSAFGLGMDYLYYNFSLNYIAITPEYFYYTSIKKSSPFININSGIAFFYNSSVGSYPNSNIFSNKVLGTNFGYKYLLKNNKEIKLSLGYKYLEMPLYSLPQNIVQGNRLPPIEIIKTNNNYFVSTLGFSF